MPAGTRRKGPVGFTLVALLLLCSGCNSRTETPPAGQRLQPAQPTNSHLRVRAPAVAGLFYPADGPMLAKTIDDLLKAAPLHQIPRLKALVCPHAGYPYSGPTAAIAYKTLLGRDVQTVVILGPSHYALFQGASVPNTDAYQTPLGIVPMSPLAAQLARTNPFVLECQCLVQRPQWWAQSSKPAPAAGQDTPDTWEHSIEVQVPFLQKTLTNFTILPVVFGEVDPGQAARVLAGMIDNKTLIVASSDLSHYHPYDQARELDHRCVAAVCDLNLDAMTNQEACGKVPILALLHLARAKGWKAQLLDYRNSGDTAGDKSAVVGYSAIAFYEAAPQNVDAKDRVFLLDIARRTLAAAAADAGAPPPPVNPRDLSTQLSQNKGCFVTLTENGALRGCIGYIEPRVALYQAVLDNARNAATRDPRFRPVRPDEVNKIKIEISVLTVPQPLPFKSPDDLLNKLQPGEDGVVLRIGPAEATFLPQVWEQLPDKVQFLNQLAQKAGCAPDDWRGRNVSVSIYHAEAFHEPE
ncbi:MAG TPA: AmmeMemoRadiSam system protein B [Candidatus Acidoferrum sp.]|nr:AmmeMemoRadiSam system protein B [Candidatus Acidoferrum sp.]